LIVVSLLLDLDLASDILTMINCYSLSHSVNLEDWIRDRMYVYHKILVLVLLICIFPRYISVYYVLFINVSLVSGILEIKSVNNRYQHILTKPDNLAKKVGIYLYRIC